MGTQDQLNELGYYAVTRHPADARVVLPEARDAEALGWVRATSASASP
jgi:5,10-methylenetetrahydromethanopterin reductase